VDSEEAPLRDITCGRQVPTGSIVTDHPAEPAWLMTRSQIIANKPSLQIDTSSVTVINRGSGPKVLLTVRQMGDEELDPSLLLEQLDPSLLLEQLSRTGVIGRIYSGIWLRLLKVSKLKT